MTKKKIEVEDVVDVSASETVEVTVKHKVFPLDIDFGREDLNALKNKINELIANQDA